jgi:hypothetical protein
MSAQPLESAPLSVQVERPELTLVPPLVDEVHQGLQDYLGDGIDLHRYDAELRKEFIGHASRKVQVGGALIVSLTIEVGNTKDLQVETHEINDSYRPFSEDLIKKLGAIAEREWKNGKGWRVDR